jgi:hypothetical protein
MAVCRNQPGSNVFVFDLCQQIPQRVVEFAQDVLTRKMAMLGKPKRSISFDRYTCAKWLRASLRATAFAVGCMAFAASAVARARYDGDWSVVITTRRGACEPSVRYGVQIINGMVVNAASGEAQIQGHVSPNGAVRVTVQAVGQWASGSGRLNLAHGGGVWHGQGNAGFCQGTWVAERRAS